MRSIICPACRKAIGVSKTDGNEPLFIECWDCAYSNLALTGPAPSSPRPKSSSKNRASTRRTGRRT